MDETEDLALPAELSDGGEDLDDTKHAKLIDAITSIDGKKKNKVYQRTVPTSQVSEFNFSNIQGKVKLNELVGTLKETASQKKLRKNLKSVQKGNKLVSVPLHRHEREKIERSVAYEKTCKELDKWDPVVEKNRQADQLVFPLQQPNLRLCTTGSLKHKFQPRTPLEVEIAKLLHGNQNIIHKNTVLTPAEEKALRAMSIEEARERRAELQKHRALLSYKEAKARWQKKIKSKKYHRILRKEKLKNEKKALEELEKTDPEAFQEKINAVNKQRIQERMNLKHRGGSKFARKQMIYAKYDDKARQNVQDMLQKSRELTEKVELVSDDSDSDDDHVKSDLEQELNDNFNKDSENPWMTAVKFKPKSLPQPDSVDSQPSGIEKLEEIKNDDVHEIKDKQNEKSDSDDDENKSYNDDDDDQIEKIFSSMKKMRKSNTSDNRGKNRKKKKNSKKKKAESEKSSGQVAGTTEKGVSESESNIESDIDEEALIAETLVRTKTLGDMDNIQLENTNKKSGKKRKRQRKKAAKEIPEKKDETSDQKSESTEVHVDPKKLFTMETKLTNTSTQNVVVDEGDDGTVDAEAEQRMTIAQAFADDDVIDEFIQEKADTVEQDKPKDIDLVLPGWGEWGGEGLQPSKRKKKRFTIKAGPAKPRRDKNLGNVILNEKDDTQIKKHQVDKLPFPFASVDQFEKSIRAPIGKDWNPETAFKQLVKPKVITKLGSVIEPIDKSEVFKKDKSATKRKADIDFKMDIKNDSEKPKSTEQKKKKK